MNERLAELVNLQFKIRNRVIQFQETAYITQKEIYETNKIVKEQLLSLKSKIQSLSEFAEEQDDESEKVNILKEVQKQTKELNNLYALLKAANIIAQINLQKTFEEERKQLIHEKGEGVRRRHVSHNGEELLEDSQRVNSKIRNLRNNMFDLSEQGTAIIKTLGFKNCLRHSRSSSQVISNVLTEGEALEEHLRSAKIHIRSYKMIELTSPREAQWIKRLEQEYAALIKYVQINKESDNDWFQIESNKDGTRWFGKCWFIHEYQKYEFDVQFDIPVAYPTTAPEIEIPELEGKTAKMYRGGKICLTDHFYPLWARNAPHFGIAHALALGLGPWLAAEVPDLIKKNKIAPKTKS